MGRVAGGLPSAEYLDATALAKLGTLKLRVQRVVEGALSGLHRSAHHGSSVEFAEHKEYAPGDDLRHLDWKALGKFDRYYIRQYEDETELKAFLLLDCSGSMGYGKPLSKLQYASVLVGSLAYLLVRQRDQPSLVAFAEEIRNYVPPRGRVSHVAALLDALASLRADGATDFRRATEHLMDVAGRHGLVVVCSDLFDATSEGVRLLRQLRVRGHHVVLLHVLHPDELELPFSQVTLFQAMESDSRMLVDPAGVRNVYLREIRRFCDSVEQACREAQVVYHRVTTSDRADAVLLDLLRPRLPRQRL